MGEGRKELRLQCLSPEWSGCDVGCPWDVLWCHRSQDWIYYCWGVLQPTEGESRPLIVVAGGGPALLGRNWLRRIYLDWKTIGSLRATQTPAAVQKSLSDLLDKYCYRYWGVGNRWISKASYMSNQMLSQVCGQACKVNSCRYQASNRWGARQIRILTSWESIPTSDWAAPICEIKERWQLLRFYKSS